MAIKVGQKLIAPAILGAGATGGYAAYDRYANQNMFADPGESAKTGAIVGLGIGAFGVSKQLTNSVSKKISHYTQATQAGASDTSAKIFSQF